jgi:hypothetical protein
MTPMWIRQLALGMGLGMMVMAAGLIGANSTWGGPATDPVVIESWETQGDGSLVEVRAAQTLVGSGSQIGRGALRIIDTLDNRVLELGYYEYGAGLFTPSLFEAWSDGFSIHSFNGSEPFLAVRDRRDFGDLRLRHDGTQGIIETTGTGAVPGYKSGGIRMGGNGPNIFATQAGTVLTMDDDGNIGIGTTDAGDGAGVVAIAEAQQPPVHNSSSGGILYVEDGALKYRGPSGTVTILAKP